MPYCVIGSKVKARDVLNSILPTLTPIHSITKHMTLTKQSFSKSYRGGTLFGQVRQRKRLERLPRRQVGVAETGCPLQTVGWFYEKPAQECACGANCAFRSCLKSLDAGLQQIRDGMAWHYKDYEREQSTEDRARYAAAETKARELRAGLWADTSPVPPWEWRKDKRARGRSTR